MIEYQNRMPVILRETKWDVFLGQLQTIAQLYGHKVHLSLIYHFT